MRRLVPTPTGNFHHLDDPGEESRADKVPRGSVTEEEGLILRALACGRDVLEIGTGTGYSTEWLAESAKSVLTLDVSPWVKQTIWPELTQATISFEDGGEEGRERAREKAPYGLIFIDGRHEAVHAQADIEYALRVSGPGSLIVLHDALDPRVQAALRNTQGHFVCGWTIPTALGLFVGVAE